MSLFRPGSLRQHEIALAIIRVLTGVIFVAHGAQKLFVYGLAGVAGSFGQIGIPMAGFVGPAVAFLEFFGGIALILGLFTRPVSLGLAFNMLGAFFFVHAAAGFFLPGGFEFVMLLLGASVALTAAGAGAFSLDSLIARRRGEPAEALPASTAAPARVGARRVA
jgi:putative oxidoreductase